MGTGYCGCLCRCKINNKIKRNVIKFLNTQIQISAVVKIPKLHFNILTQLKRIAVNMLMSVNHFHVDAVHPSTHTFLKMLKTQ